MSIDQHWCTDCAAYLIPGIWYIIKYCSLDHILAIWIVLENPCEYQNGDSEHLSMWTFETRSELLGLGVSTLLGNEA